MTVSRTRWAAIGAACAVALGGGALGVVRATVSSGDRTAYFPITPTRVLDTRNTTEISDSTLLLTVEGLIAIVGEPSTRAVVPTDASAVAINLTVTGGRKRGNYGFVTAYPCTTASNTPPNASSLNFENGVDIANALNVTTSTNGSICLYVYGTADLIVDIAGYYADHNHDDRYYTKAQTDALIASAGGSGSGSSTSTNGLRLGVPLGPSSIDSSSTVEGGTSITIGSNGNPIVSYHDIVNGDLKVATCSTTTCTSATTATADSEGNVGSYSSIAVGVNGNPVIAYYDIDNSALKVAACGSPACVGAVSRVTVDNFADVGQHVSVVIGNEGSPMIAYYDATSGDLRYVACTSADCSSALSPVVIDQAGNVGEYVSLALGIDGNPVMSYYDRTNGNLKVATCADVGCTGATVVSNVDTSGDVGLHSSIAIGRKGFPIISYYGSTTDELKTAACVTTTCEGTSAVTVVDSGADLLTTSKGQAPSGTCVSAGSFTSSGTCTVLPRETVNFAVQAGHGGGHGKGGNGGSGGYGWTGNSTSLPGSGGIGQQGGCLGTGARIAGSYSNSSSIPVTLTLSVGSNGANGTPGTNGSVGLNAAQTSGVPANGGDGGSGTSGTPGQNGTSSSVFIGASELVTAGGGRGSIGGQGGGGGQGGRSNGQTGANGLTYGGGFAGTNGNSFSSPSPLPAGWTFTTAGDACSLSSLPTPGVTFSGAGVVNDVGYDTAIAIGGDGRPIISYYDASSGDLRIAWCVDYGCTGIDGISTVDTTNDVGRSTSIAIGIDGKPVVSYRDVTNQDLKVAVPWWSSGGR